MGMGFVPTWLRQVSPLLHKTTLTTDPNPNRNPTVITDPQVEIRKLSPFRSVPHIRPAPHFVACSVVLPGACLYRVRVATVEWSHARRVTVNRRPVSCVLRRRARASLAIFIIDEHGGSWRWKCRTWSCRTWKSGTMVNAKFVHFAVDPELLFREQWGNGCRSTSEVSKKVSK